MTIKDANAKLQDLAMEVMGNNPELADKLLTTQMELNEAWRAYCKRIAYDLMEPDVDG
jgi:hypothetical protein